MEAVNATLRPDDFTSSTVTILFTTESPRIVEECVNFTSNTELLSHHAYNYSFIRNKNDVLPDTGDFHRPSKRVGAPFTADENVISALTTMKLQLFAQTSFFNCCSHFHTIMRELLHLGLGSSRNHHPICMDTMKDPRLRICCTWTPQCKEKKMVDLANLTRIR